MPNRISRVLVIRWGPVGDFVLSLAAARQIRAAHPKAEIHLLTTPEFAELARKSPYFDEVDLGAEVTGPGSDFQLARRIRHARFDRVYDLQCTPRTALIFRMMWPGRPVWSGVARGAKLRHRNSRRDRMHILERQADQLRVAGVWPDAPTEPGEAPGPDLSWILKAAPVSRPAGAPLPVRPILVPGGSSNPEKLWPIDSWCGLAVALQKRGYDLVIVGSPSDSGLAHTIQRTVGNARDLTGRTDLAQLAALAARSSLAVGNASGAIQTIAAAGAPTVALFSQASDPALNGPRGHVTVLKASSLGGLSVAQVAHAALALVPARA
jgi:ADP-heptose:LPS heptosyltransferase